MKKVIISLACVAVLVGLYCVTSGAIQPDPGTSGNGTAAGNIPFERMAFGDLGDDVKSRVDENRAQEGYEILQSGNDCYLVVYAGERPTGGYGVEITGVTGGDGGITATVRETAPGKGDIVTQALTYPYDVAKLGSVISGSVELDFVN